MKIKALKYLIFFLPVILIAVLLNMVINRVKSEPTTSTLTDIPLPVISVSETSPMWATDSAFLSIESELKTIKDKLSKPPTDNFPLVPPQFNFDLGFGL